MSAFSAPAQLGAETSSTRMRDRVGQALLVIAALGAAFAVVGAIDAVANATAATRMVETWRLLGFAAFAAIFVLLAYRPRVYAGIWELAILNKLGLTIAAFAYGTEVDGARTALVADGAVTLLLLAAYLLTRGWRAWSTVRSVG
jgi:hypothetical protein